MSNILEVSGLIHRYDGVDESTFHNVDLNLQPGELLAVLGASGSGKSTFLRCIAGLEEPSGGGLRLMASLLLRVGAKGYRRSIEVSAWSFKTTHSFLQ